MKQNREDTDEKTGGCPFCDSKLQWDEGEGIYICFACLKSFELQSYGDNYFIVYQDRKLISQEEYDNM